MKFEFKFLVLLTICLVSPQDSLAQASNSGVVINKSIDAYNKKKYDESIELLESVKNSSAQYVNWHYYYAINMARLKKYEVAIENFEQFIRGSEVNKTARAYYYMGLMQFYMGNYEKALNSLELSLDVSQDSKLDNITETLIDKTIRYQNYFDKNKKTNFLILFGYNLDSNVINLAPSSITEKVNGHVFNYGASAAFKVIDRYSLVVEPTLVALDAYTLDSQLKPNSTLQGTDALQLLLSIPFRFYDESVKNSNRYDISVNVYNIYLPILTSTRELSLSSYSVKTQIISFLSDKYSIKYGGSVSLDQSYGFTSSDDDASGLRLSLSSTLIQYLADTSKNIFYDVSVDVSGTNGINTKYKRLSTGAGYIYPSFWNTNSSLRLGLEYLNYGEKTTPRTDSQFNFSYNVAKELSDTASVLFNLKALNNSSDSEIYKYNDLVISAQYTKSFGF